MSYNIQTTIPHLSAKIRYDAPSPELYSFHGFVKLNSVPTRSNLTHNNLILRGSRLLGNSWVVGIVAYTGMETKLYYHKKGQNNRIKLYNYI